MKKRMVFGLSGTGAGFEACQTMTGSTQAVMPHFQ